MSVHSDMMMPASGPTTLAAGGCAGQAPAAATEPAVTAIRFTDPGHGWAAGAGRIVATSDGGRTWATQYTAS